MGCGPRKLADPKFYVDYVRVLLGEFLRDFYHRHRPIFPETYWFQETWVAAFFAG